MYLSWNKNIQRKNHLIINLLISQFIVFFFSSFKQNTHFEQKLQQSNYFTGWIYTELVIDHLECFSFYHLYYQACMCINVWKVKEQNNYFIKLFKYFKVNKPYIVRSQTILISSKEMIKVLGSLIHLIEKFSIGSNPLEFHFPEFKSILRVV